MEAKPLTTGEERRIKRFAYAQLPDGDAKLISKQYYRLATIIIQNSQSNELQEHALNRLWESKNWAVASFFNE